MLDVYLTTQKGYRTVLQACWYLDLIKYGVQWQAFYACDPGNFNGMNLVDKPFGCIFSVLNLFLSSVLYLTHSRSSYCTYQLNCFIIAYIK